MADRKDKPSDEESLKHYRPAEGFPAPSGSEPESELPAGVKELLDKARASNPEFVKAEIAIDPIRPNPADFQPALDVCAAGRLFGFPLN